ncbi:MAG: protein kinase, partial [Chloroflexota bacterium]
IGTPAYMSPEQANGFPLDARSDIYSLGVVLFELITGKEPYQAETPMALLLKHINEPMPPLSNYRKDIPSRVEDVIAKATAKDPNNRYSSAGEMSADFSEAIRQTGSYAKQTPQMMYEDSPTILPDSRPRLTPPPSTGRASQPAMPAPTAPITGQQSVTQAMTQGSKMPLIIGGVVAVAVIAIVALVVIPNSTPAPINEVQATAGIPTPFASARTIETDQYTVSIPSQWIPPQGFLDLSTDQKLVHLWQPSGLESYAAVIIPKNTILTDAASFKQAAADYTQSYYKTERAADLTLIDEATAPDGTIRQSYRHTGDTETPLPGQVDVFYINRAPQLVIVEVYSADQMGNQLVTTFQNILDSLHVKGA